LPLPTRDPFSDGELIVTRLESVDTGVQIEGRFGLGWIGRLSHQQVDFVGLLLRHRTNLQRLASELGISYNTARARLDEIVTALEDPGQPANRGKVLERLAAHEISPEEAADLLGRRR
jgi:hypothetical protein